MEVARVLWLGQSLQLDGLMLWLRKIIFDHGRRFHKMCLAVSKFDRLSTNCVPVHFCIKNYYIVFDKKSANFNDSLIFNISTNFYTTIVFC